MMVFALNEQTRGWLASYSYSERRNIMDFAASESKGFVEQVYEQETRINYAANDENERRQNANERSKERASPSQTLVVARKTSTKTI